MLSDIKQTEETGVKTQWSDSRDHNINITRYYFGFLKQPPDYVTQKHLPVLLERKVMAASFNLQQLGRIQLSLNRMNAVTKDQNYDEKRSEMRCSD